MKIPLKSDEKRKFWNVGWSKLVRGVGDFSCVQTLYPSQSLIIYKFKAFLLRNTKVVKMYKKRKLNEF